MKTYLKLPICLLLFLTISTPAFALVPLALSAAEMLAAELSLQYGLEKFVLKTSPEGASYIAKATPFGIKRALAFKVGKGLGALVIGTVGYAALRELVGSPDTDSGKLSPALSAALYKSNMIPPEKIAYGDNVGDIVFIDGQIGYLKITSIGTTGCGGNNPPSTRLSGGTATVVEAGAASGCYAPSMGWYTRVANYGVVPIQLPPIYSPRPDDEISPVLNTPSLDELYPQALSNLDKVLTSNPKILSVPADDLAEVKKQIAANKMYDSLDKKKTALTDIRDAAKAKYDANPTEENKAALAKAEADLASVDAEIAEKEKADAESEKDDLDKEKAADEIDTVEWTNPDAPELSELDFSPLLTIGSAVTNKFPFSLLKTVSAMASSLVASPVAPSFTIHFPAPFNYDWIVSLQAWDTWAALFRFLIGAAFLVAISMTILRRWV